jgi:hypothetical protein
MAAVVAVDIDGHDPMGRLIPFRRLRIKPAHDRRAAEI